MYSLLYELWTCRGFVQDLWIVACGQGQVETKLHCFCLLWICCGLVVDLMYNIIAYTHCVHSIERSSLTDEFSVLRSTYR